MHKDSPDWGFDGGGFIFFHQYVVYCFAPISWSHRGGAQLCVLLALVHHVALKVTDTKTGACYGPCPRGAGFGGSSGDPHADAPPASSTHPEGRPSGKPS